MARDVIDEAMGPGILERVSIKLNDMFAKHNPYRVSMNFASTPAMGVISQVNTQGAVANLKILFSDAGAAFESLKGAYKLDGNQWIHSLIADASLTNLQIEKLRQQHLTITPV